MYEGLIDIPILSNIPDLVAKPEPTVYIRWTDQAKAPIKKIEEWQGLLRSLRGTSLPIAVACMGGHGRTGTFLSIMAWLMGLPQKENSKPIEYIRKIYCVECVESKVQFEQVKDLTGIDETSLYQPIVYNNYAYGGYDGWFKDGDGYSYWKPKGQNTKDDKPFAPSHNPDDDNIKYGYFWCKRHHGSFEKLQGTPANAGQWDSDTHGWFWRWEKDEKEEYYPLETMGEVDVDADPDMLDEYDEVIMPKDFLGDYQPNGDSNGDSLI